MGIFLTPVNVRSICAVWYDVGPYESPPRPRTRWLAPRSRTGQRKGQSNIPWLSKVWVPNIVMRPRKYISLFSQTQWVRIQGAV